MNVVVLKTVGVILVTDRYGNTLAADTVLPVTITTDTTAPTITKVEATAENTVKVTFSEDVTGAGTKANYVFKKADGTVIAATAYGNPAYAANVATITFTPALTGGAYSVEVSNIKDASLSTNALAVAAMPFTVSDKTPITTATSIKVENTGTTADVIYITFPENMSVSGVNSVLDKANYTIGTAATPSSAVALSADATIAVFGTNDKVKVTLPGTGAADLAGKSLFVKNVADASGNVITSLFIEIALTPDAAPVVTAIKTTALNTFVLTVDKQLSGINASDIKVDTAVGGGTVAVAQATYVNNADGTATITIIVPAAEALANSGLLPDVIEITAGGNIKSITGTAMAADADLTAIGGVNVTPTDAVAPAIAATTPVTTYDTNNNGKIDRVVVEYTESINAATVALLSFDVAGYAETAEIVVTDATAALAAANTNPGNGKFVKITITEGATSDTGALPTVTQLTTITDVAGNSLAASAAVASTDKAAPVLLTATTVQTAATKAMLATTKAFTVTMGDDTNGAYGNFVKVAILATGANGSGVTAAWDGVTSTLNISLAADGLGVMTLNALKTAVDAVVVNGDAGDFIVNVGVNGANSLVVGDAIAAAAATGGQDVITATFNEDILASSITTATLATDFNISGTATEAGTSAVSGAVVTLTVTTADAQVKGQTLNAVATQVTDAGANEAAAGVTPTIS